MTLTGLQTEIARKLNDTDNARWTTAILLDRINHIIRDIVLRTKCLRDVGQSSIVSGTAEYALPTGYLDMIAVTLNGIDLQYRDKNELNLLSNSDWTTLNGTPKSYYVDIDPDNSKIGMFPNPQAGDVGTNNLKMYYVRAPVDLSAATDIPFNIGTATTSNLLVAHHYTIVYGATAMCLEDNIVDPSTKIKHDQFMMEYERGLAKIADIFNNPSDRMMTMAGGRFWKTNTGKVPWTE